MTMLKMRRPLMVVVAAGAAAAFVAMLAAGGTPPRGTTVARLSVTAIKFLEFAQTNNRVPEKLADLGDNRLTKDGWGHNFLFEANSDGTITLTSYGKDGRPGGEGDNADSAVVFNVRGRDGKWLSQVEWISTPWPREGKTETQP